MAGHEAGGGWLLADEGHNGLAGARPTVPQEGVLRGRLVLIMRYSQYVWQLSISIRLLSATW
jgi:hypothetical protein